MDRKIPVSHFLQTREVETAALDAFFDGCASEGVEALSLTPRELEPLLSEPERQDALRRASHRSGVRFLNAHAPYGERWDLNCPDPSRRAALLAGQKHVFELCASFGIESVTMHVGTNDSGRPLPELREHTRRSLAELLPEAEKHGIILAVENTLFPTDAPGELLNYLTEFACPALGVCFDAGHANLMDAAPGKRSEMMVDWIQMRWKEGVRFQADTLALLLPYVVTCHLHDNRGFNDEHLLAGDGTIDWPKLFGRLSHAPRLRSFQNEANMAAYRIVPRRAVDRFTRLTAPAPAL